MADTRRSDTYDDDRLVQYLIGSLDEQETERFDELSISDDQFADRLRIVEDDLVDAYATGELSGDVRARFEAHYLKLPGKQDRIRFAEALALLQRPGARDQVPGSLPAPPRQAPVAIVLIPTIRRVAEPPTLSISRGTPTVEVSLVIEGDDFPTYSVALKDAGSDRILWKGSGLRASSSGADRIVLVSLDPELLKPQHYTLDLSGVRPPGRSEVITSYPFRVVLN